MRARIQRWGNSLALRLPKSMAESLAIEAGSLVVVEERGGQLVVKPAYRYQLEELLADVRQDQMHAEVSWGARRGKESW